MYERIKRWYSMGLWTEEMVNIAKQKGIISKEECSKILDGHEEVENADE